MSETTAQAGAQGMARSWTGSKAALLFGVAFGIVTLDFFTKLWVQENFHLYQQLNLIGDYVRLTFIYNPGAAFGIHLGDYSRVVFLTLSLVALVALGVMYWYTPVSDRIRLVALALICGGALGNLVDRVRSSLGVVDFMDIGVGDVRWPVFNVADVAVTTGAVFLALSLFRDERQRAGRKPA